MPSFIQWSGSSGNPSLEWSMRNGKRGFLVIKFPLELKNGWYNKQPCTAFQTFQHRKERGVLKHEFILLKLKDGSVCRVERMGDPNARFNALSPQGSVAQDIAWCFGKDELEEADLDDSDVITEVELPCEFDIMDVLKICRAIQEGEKTCNYTLQVYNCYFFSLAIQVCLTRLVAHWEDKKSLGVWLSHISDAVQGLTNTDQTITTLTPLSPYPTIIQLYSILLCDDERTRLMNDIKFSLRSHIAGTIPQELAYRINDLLWHSTISPSLSEFTEGKVKMAFVEVFSKRSLQSPNSTSGSVEPLEELKNKLPRIFIDLMAQAGAVYGLRFLRTDNQEQSNQPVDEPERVSPVPKLIKQKSINQPQVEHSPKNLAPEMDFNAPRKGLKEAALERVATTGDTLVHWFNLKRDAIQWGLYLWRFFLWALHQAILSIWGIRILTSEPDVHPCTIIEEELMVALKNLDGTSFTYSDLECFIRKMRVLSANQAAIWDKRPWEDVYHFIEQRTASNFLEQLHKPKLKVKSGDQSNIAMTVSSFQERVLERIVDQGRKVEKVWLGSAARIQLELEETLSQVWKNIRDDMTINRLKPLGTDAEVHFRLHDGIIAVETDRTSVLHALIIGINDYPNLPKLKGAVADADEFANFLESELKVPPDHIINLRDDTATRRNIIGSIRSLQNNPQINYRDPILIYYAGQGGSRKATKEWLEVNGTYLVEVIFPFDYDARVHDSSTSDPIECIPDRTIIGLLNELSEAKGDNITVIFDSCHSFSGRYVPTRKGVLGRRERSTEVKRDIPWDIDLDIIRPAPPSRGNETRYTELPLCTNQTSHIHLAACGLEEMAYEEGGRGVFTMALLKNIRANGVDKITYHGLIESLPSLSSQSPHCYGKHKGRILFNSNVPSRRTLMIPVEFKAESEEIILQAGAASSVATGSIWEIYNSVTEKVSFGRFRALSPSISTTELQPEEKGGGDLYLDYVRGEGFGTRTYARQVGVGVTDDLRVYFTPRAKERIFPANEIEPALSYPVGSGKHDVGYVVHGAEDSADIAVDLHDSDGRVSFRLCDRRAEQYGVAILENRVRAERSAVDEVLFAAAKWKWHLQRKNTDSWQITDPVEMDLIKVGVKRGPHRIMFPVEERMSMNASGMADFEVDQRDLYGVQLTSQVDQPLYVRMFYFDTTDFSIADIFGHSTGKYPVISPKGSFLIGDGAEGGAPLRFKLDKNQKLDLGYLKVFWSTKPLELEGTGQRPTFNRVSRKWSRLRGCERYVDQGIEWGTALLTLVQR